MSSDVARRWQQGFEAYKKASGTVGTMQGLVSETKRAHFIDYDELVSDSDADELSDDDDDGYYNRHDDDGDQDVESRSSFGGTNSSKRRCFLCVCTAKSFRLWWRRWRQHLWDLVVALLPVCDGAHTLQIALEGSFWRVIFFTIVLLPSLSITTFAFVGCGADASGSDLLEDAAVDVVGHSMGGLVAQELAHAAPSEVRRLVLASTSPGGDGLKDLVSRDYFDVLDDWQDDDGASESLTLCESDRPRARAGSPAAEAARRRAAAAYWVIGLPRHYVEANVDALKQLVDDMVDASVAKREAATIQAQKRMVLSPFPSADRFKEAGAPPTLVLHGDVDAILDPFCGMSLAQTIPRAKLLLLAGVGHHAFTQEPEEWATCVADFLDADDV